MKTSTQRWRRINRARFGSAQAFRDWEAKRKRRYRKTHPIQYQREIGRNRRRYRWVGGHRLNVSALLESVRHMTMEIDKPVLEVVGITEAARRLRVCGNTLRRAVEREGVTPDAIIIAGSKQKRSPLFVEARLQQLAKLIKA